VEEVAIRVAVRVAIPMLASLGNDLSVLWAYTKK